ncbi:MAG: DNA-binding protein [Candidatus Latescibacterota bacterium]|nr:MAG: DNA-binding protein [Candidatus Latescibacterota bacterium]
MRPEVRYTMAQAEEDLDTARVLLENDKYYASVFFSQQAAEKALKALYIHIKREYPRTHNLVELAQDLEAPEEILEAVKELNPDYLSTRYVNAANGIPAQMYTRRSAEVHLEYAREVSLWTRRRLEGG